MARLDGSGKATGSAQTAAGGVGRSGTRAACTVTVGGAVGRFVARNLSWPRSTSPIVNSSSSPSLQRTSCRKGSEASAGAEVPTTVSHTVPSKSPTPGKLRRIWTPRRDAATASLYVESASWSSVISGADGRAGRERLRLSRGGGTADRPRGWLESSYRRFIRMEVVSGAAPRRPAPFWRVVTIRTVTDRGPQATV